MREDRYLGDGSPHVAQPSGPLRPHRDSADALPRPLRRTVNSDYETAVTDALLDLQNWYSDQLDGSTFALFDPIVAPLLLPHSAAYYATNPNGPVELWFWLNVLSDAFALTGAQFDDPNHAWVFYIDADFTCGQIIGGTSAVALLGANDLRGLTGGGNVPACPGEAPDLGGPNRWIGGLGHELGHAFGLPHPANCPGPNCPEDALMWLGFRNYPNTFLLPEDKATLQASRFIEPIPEPASLLLLGAGLLGLGAYRERLTTRRKRLSAQERLTSRGANGPVMKAD